MAEDQDSLLGLSSPMVSSAALETNPGTKKGRQHRDLTGVVLDGIYKLEAKCNGGGMGEIWRARHLTLDTQWLVKLLPAAFSEESSYVEALMREAKLTANLPGGYFPVVVHSGISAEIAFYVMQDIPGKDLGRVLSEDYPRGMSAAQALPLLEQILEAMSVAHDEGVIHRDLKPDNIFVETIPKGAPKIRILDFGVAKANSEVYATISKALPRGTQQYMPPELHKPIPDAVSPATDVFAIGLVAYEMILGRHPFAATDYVKRYEDGKELGLLHETREGKRAGLNAEISEVLYAAVRFDPQTRFSDAGTMLRVLRFASEFRPESISVGTVLNNSYRVVEPLGAGGMGAVYVVEDIHYRIKEKQVLKIVVPPPGCEQRALDQLRERFRRECAALHALQHEAIPHIYGNESHEGHPFLVMEYAAGATMGRAFHTLLSQGGWGAVFKMARQVASALDAVHAEGIVHRDIKPSNIVLDPETANAVVLDFGIVHTSDTQLTAEGVRIGTPGFSAPEQMMGAPVPASDQWSLAACFYALLTGLRPGALPGEEDACADRLQFAYTIDERVVSDGVLPFGDAVNLLKLVEVPDAVVAAITRAMAYDPEDRYSSVKVFVEAMEVGIVNLAAPVHVDAPTDVPKEWLGSEEGRETETPRAKPAAPVVLTTPSFGPASVVAPESTVEETRWAPAARRYLPLITSLIVLLAFGGYLLWGRGGQTSTKAETVRSAESSAAYPDLPAAAVVDVADAGPPVALEPTKTAVDVVATHNGKRLDGLQLRIGELTQVNPFRVSLPIGETLVYVDTPDYLGVYPCTVTEGSSVCEIHLVAQVAASKQKPRRKKGVSKDPSDPSMLIHQGEGAKMGTFYNDDPEDDGEKKK